MITGFFHSWQNQRYPSIFKTRRNPKKPHQNQKQNPMFEVAPASFASPPSHWGAAARSLPSSPHRKGPRFARPLRGAFGVLDDGTRDDGIHGSAGSPALRVLRCVRSMQSGFPPLDRRKNGGARSTFAERSEAKVIPCSQGKKGVFFESSVTRASAAHHGRAPRERTTHERAQRRERSAGSRRSRRIDPLGSRRQGRRRSPEGVEDP